MWTIHKLPHLSWLLCTFNKSGFHFCADHFFLLFVGGVSLTLRHRLECKIATEQMVSTAQIDDVCLLSPDQEKTRRNFTHFDIKDKQPWSSKLHKEMLVRIFFFFFFFFYKVVGTLNNVNTRITLPVQEFISKRISNIFVLHFAYMLYA